MPVYGVTLWLAPTVAIVLITFHYWRLHRKVKRAIAAGRKEEADKAENALNLFAVDIPGMGCFILIMVFMAVSWTAYWMRH